MIIFERKVTDRPYPEQAEAGSEEEEGAKARSGGARKALNESDAVYACLLLARARRRPPCQRGASRSSRVSSRSSSLVRTAYEQRREQRTNSVRAAYEQRANSYEQRVRVHSRIDLGCEKGTFRLSLTGWAAQETQGRRPTPKVQSGVHHRIL